MIKIHWCNLKGENGKKEDGGKATGLCLHRKHNWKQNWE